MPYDIQSFFSENADVIAFYFPLGVIGFWRWGIWLFKELVALFYRPKTKPHSISVSIITPVYNEDPKVFSQALDSWEDNNPNEIIAVIDYTDKACINIFRSFSKKRPSAKLIITKVPGKRPALADGIKIAKSDIVALVDSDTVWSKDVLKYATSPFVDPKIGGVGTRQNVIKPKTLAQIIFDIQLDHRYADEMPFLAVSSDALTCLSGRTAFYRKTALLPLLDELVNEKFAGQNVISGEDKRLTYLVEKKGWKTTYQGNAIVYTHGVEDVYTFFSQRIRWSRNSWRADLSALKEGWIFRHPFLAFHIIDKIIQPFTSIVAPFYFLLSILAGFWHIALLIVIWWHVSRAIKIFPHLKRRPQDIIILPLYIMSNFIFGFTKIYALFTMQTQGWITRWDKTRLQQFSVFQKAPAYVATLLVILFVGNTIAYSNQYVFFLLPFSVSTQQSLGLVTVKELAFVPKSVLGAQTSSVDPYKRVIRIHEVQKGDFLSSIAVKYAVTPQQLLIANSAQLPSWSSIQVSQLLVIPQHPINVPRSPEYNFQQKYFPYLQVTYDKKTNTIILDGRGNTVTLTTIRKALKENLVKEIKPKEWMLSANVLVKNGVTLRLTNNEVVWLKLASNTKQFNWVRVESGSLDVNSVKITSWDTSKKDVDKNEADGRAYILVKYGSIIRIRDAELAFLGYIDPKKNEETYGITANLSSTSKDKYILSGEITNSSFHHNYQGLSLQGVYGVYVRDNTISQNNQGLVLMNTSHNIVTNNTISSNLVGLLLKNAQLNTIENNKFIENSTYGMQIDRDSKSNSVVDNILSKNVIAMQVEGSDNSISKNSIKENRTGVLLSGVSSNNTLINNVISQNRLFAVLVKTVLGNKNYLVENR